MRSYDCTPVSTPQLPPTHQHPMWKAWDLAVDVSLAQLPSISSQSTPYKASSFFEEQLTAFEVWLRFGDQQRPPPEQLPIVLQVLLSQAHRLRALDLLGRFLDLGPWAVNLALSVGIFPYVLKLLQASARELRPLLVSIWAKILSVDTSCQTDLIRDASHRYFLSVLQDDVMMPNHRTWAAFILASIVHNFRQGQQEAEQVNSFLFVFSKKQKIMLKFKEFCTIFCFAFTLGLLALSRTQRCISTAKRQNIYCSTAYFT